MGGKTYGVITAVLLAICVLSAYIQWNRASVFWVAKDGKRKIMPGYYIQMQRKDMPYSVGRNHCGGKKADRVTAAIFHTLFWEKRAEKYRKNIRYRTGYPAGRLKHEGVLLWNAFIPDGTDRKTEIHRKWQAGNQGQVSGFISICKVLKNLRCLIFCIWSSCVCYCAGPWYKSGN